MKQLRVFFQEEALGDKPIDLVACRLSEAEKHPLAFAPWEAAFPYRPEVHFSIAYDRNHLYLQYEVKEAYLQAAQGKTNQPVYRDSCVEFFISFDEGASYYNFEFNCIGTVLAEYGTERSGRALLPEAVLRSVSCRSLLRKAKDETARHWELTVVLPLEVFTFHSLQSLQGKQCRANFYKCGDDLPEPHFLAWSDIQSRSPDFHLPEFFGMLLFE